MRTSWAWEETNKLYHQGIIMLSFPLPDRNHRSTHETVFLECLIRELEYKICWLGNTFLISNIWHLLRTIWHGRIHYENGLQKRGNSMASNKESCNAGDRGNNSEAERSDLRTVTRRPAGWLCFMGRPGRHTFIKFIMYALVRGHQHHIVWSVALNCLGRGVNQERILQDSDHWLQWRWENPKTTEARWC